MTKSVLHVITSLERGGAEQMLKRIVLANSGADDPLQIVVSLMDEGVHGKKLNDAGVSLYCLNMQRRLPSPVALLQLVRLLRRYEPDVIMSWLYHADLFGTLAAFLAGRGMVRRLIWNLRCSDMELARYAPRTDWVVRLLARLSPLVGAVACNSNAGIKHHIDRGYRPKRWVYLPNGFDCDKWRPDDTDRAAVRAELGLEDDMVAIGMVARTDPQKDYATFIAAAEYLCARNNQVRFVLIGGGTDGLPLTEQLAGRALRLGERRDVPRLMRGIDVAVLCSAFGEGFPNVVGEAMATGVPCVVSDVGDCAALVAETGIVVPPRSPVALTEGLARLLNEADEKRRLRGQAARLRIREHFELSRAVAQYKAIWHSVAQERQNC